LLLIYIRKNNTYTKIEVNIAGKGDDMSEIYLAGGCFWSVEKYIKLVRGVLSTQVGYANGRTENPTYEDVCYNNTGHVEAVKVTYDAKILPLDFLLNLFFDAILRCDFCNSELIFQICRKIHTNIKE